MVDDFECTLTNPYELSNPYQFGMVFPWFRYSGSVFFWEKEYIKIMYYSRLNLVVKKPGCKARDHEFKSCFSQESQ